MKLITKDGEREATATEKAKLEATQYEKLRDIDIDKLIAYAKTQGWI